MEVTRADRSLAGALEGQVFRMDKMHFTLTRPVNAGFIVLWGLAAFIMVIWARPRPILTVAIGCVAGLAAGLIQRGRVRNSPDMSTQAKSALEVRRAFMSKRAGKWSIALLWSTGLILVVVSFAGGGNPTVAAIAGYMSFLFVREITAFGASRAIQQGP